MIIRSDNNLEIYQMLEEKGKLMRTYENDSVVAFEDENDYCLVIFCLQNKNFTSFFVKDHIRANALPELKETIEMDEHLSTSIKDMAVDLINDMIADTAIFRFYDAH